MSSAGDGAASSGKREEDAPASPASPAAPAAPANSPNAATDGDETKTNAAATPTTNAETKFNKLFAMGVVEAPDKSVPKGDDGLYPQAANAFCVPLIVGDGLCGLRSLALVDSLSRRAEYASVNGVPKGERVLVIDGPVMTEDGQTVDECLKQALKLRDRIIEWIDPKHHDEQVGGQFVNPKTGEPNMTRKEWIQTFVLHDLSLGSMEDYAGYLRQRYQEVSKVTIANEGSNMGWIGLPELTILSSLLNIRVEVFERNGSTLNIVQTCTGFDASDSAENELKAPARFFLRYGHFVPLLPKRMLERVIQNSRSKNARELVFNERMFSLDEYCNRTFFPSSTSSRRRRYRASRRQRSEDGIDNEEEDDAVMAGAGVGAGAGAAATDASTIATMQAELLFGNPGPTQVDLAAMHKAMGMPEFTATTGRRAVAPPKHSDPQVPTDIRALTAQSQIAALQVLQKSLARYWDTDIVMDPYDGFPRMSVRAPQKAADQPPPLSLPPPAVPAPSSVAAVMAESAPDNEDDEPMSMVTTPKTTLPAVLHPTGSPDEEEVQVL